MTKRRTITPTIPIIPIFPIMRAEIPNNPTTKKAILKIRVILSSKAERSLVMRFVTVPR